MRRTRALLTLLAGVATSTGCASPSSDTNTDGIDAVSSRTSLGGGSGAVDAEPPEVSQPLTVAVCVRLALSRAPDLAAFEARVEGARARVEIEETWPNPVLGAHAIDIGDAERFLAQVQVTHPVFFAWTRSLSRKVARAALDGARLDVDEEQRLIAAAVGEAFYDALAAEELVDAEHDAVRMAADLCKILSQRAALGDASLLDEERATAEELEARRIADMALERREITRILLAQLIGAKRPEALRFVRDWPSLEPSLIDPSPAAGEGELKRGKRLDDLVAEAVDRRSDARRARTRVEEAELTQDLEERRALPLADVQATIGLRSGEPGNTGLLGFTVPLPFFDSNQGGRRRAAADLLGASAEVGRVIRRIEAEVSTAYLACQRANRRLHGLAIPVSESRRRATELAQRLFDGGELGPTDLVLIERDAVGANRAVVTARRELAGARWRLLVACGARW